MASVGKRALSDRRETYLRRPEDDDGPPVKKKMRKALIEIFNSSSLCLKSADERMNIYLRVKPFLKDDEECENQKCFLINEEEDSVVANPPSFSHTFKNLKRGIGKTSHKFTFSKVFNDKTSQADLFNATMLDMTKEFISGQNSLVFTYGVTSSGKTYTIQGKPDDAGVLPRCLDVLFNSIQNRQIDGIKYKPHMFTDVVILSPEEELAEKKLKQKLLRLTSGPNVMTTFLGEDSESTLSDTMASGTSTNDDSLSDVENRVRENLSLDVKDCENFCYSIWISFAEIYNEQIFDLLVPISKKNMKRPTLKICDDKTGSPYIRGLREIHVQSADEAFKLLTIGQHNLQTASTHLNHCSSRSHSIFTIKIIRTVDKEDPNIAKMNMLSLCDLAGSERSNQTKVDGARLKEAGSINLSLMTLSRCIDVLRYNQIHRDQPRMVPFRDSKLTRLFQNFFNGSGRSAMIVNVSQRASLFDETLNVFKFSAIAKQVRYISKPPEPSRVRKKAAPVSERSSIAWANPEKESILEEASNEALPEEEDEDDKDLEDDDDTDVDSICSIPSETMQQMQGQIKMLRDKNAQLAELLKEEMINSGNIEMRVRKEVTDAMNKQMVLMEQEYSDIMRETKEDAEEDIEDRVQSIIDIYEEKLQKIHHKVNEEDEWVSSILFYREQSKVKDRDKKINQLETECEQLKTSQVASDQNSTTTSLKQEPETNNLKVKIVEEEFCQNQDAKNHIASLEEELKQMKFQYQQTDDLLNQHKEELKSLRLEMQSKIMDKDTSIETLEGEIRQKQEAENHIASLEEELKQMKSQYQGADELLNQHKEELKSLRLEIESKIMDKDLTIETLEGEFHQKQVEAENHIASLEEELKQVESQYQGADELLNKHKEELKSLRLEIESKIMDKDLTIETLEGEFRQKQVEAENHIASLEEELKQKKSQYQGADELLKQQEVELKSLRLEMESKIMDKDTSIETLEGEFHQKQEATMASLKQELKEMTVLHQEATDKLNQQMEDMESLKVETDLEIQCKDKTIKTLEEEFHKKQSQEMVIASLKEELLEMDALYQKANDQLNEQKTQAESFLKETDLKLQNKDNIIKSLEERQETRCDGIDSNSNDLVGKLKACELANAALRNKLKMEEEDFFKREQALIHGYTAEVDNLHKELAKQKHRFEGHTHAPTTPEKEPMDTIPHEISSERTSNLGCEVLTSEVVSLREELLSSLSSYKQLQLQGDANNTNSFIHSVVLGTPNEKGSTQGMFQSEENVDNTFQFELTESALKIEELKGALDSQITHSTERKQQVEDISNKNFILEANLKEELKKRLHLEDICEKRNLEILELQEEIDDVSSRLETDCEKSADVEKRLENALEEIQIENSELKKEAEKRLLEIEQFEEEVKKLNLELAGNKQEIIEKNEMLDVMSVQLHAALTTKSSMSDKLKESDVKIEKLEEELNARNSEIQQKTSELNDQYKLNFEREKQFESEQNTMKQKFEEGSDLKVKFQMLEKEMILKEHELQEAKSKWDNSIQEMSHLKEEIENIREHHQEESGNVSQKLVRLEREKRMLEKSLSEAKGNLQVQQMKSEDLEKMHECEQQLRKELKSTSEAMSRHSAISSELKEELAVKATELKELKEEIDELKCVMTKLQSEKEDLIKEREQLERAEAVALESSSKLSELKKGLFECEETMEKQDKIIIDQDKKIRELEAGNEEMFETLETEKEKAEASRKHLQKELSKQEDVNVKNEAEIKRLQEELSDQENINKRNGEKLECLEKELSQAKDTDKVSGEEAQRLQRKLSEQEMCNKKIKEDMKRLQRELSEQEMCNKKIKEDMKQVEKELSKQDSINKRNREEMENWKKERDECVSSLEYYLKDLKVKNSELTQDVEKLKKDNADMAKNVDDTTTAKDALIAELRKSNNTLSIQFASMQGLSPPPKIATPNSIFPVVKDFEDDIDTPRRIEIDATPPIAAKKIRKRAGSRKNSSSSSVDPDESNVENRDSSRICLKTIEESEEKSSPEKHPLRSTRNLSTILSGFSPLTRAAKREQKSSQVKAPFDIQPYSNMTETRRGTRQSSRLRQKEKDTY